MVSTMRTYFYADAASSFAFVDSLDAGLTWSAPTNIDLPGLFQSDRVIVRENTNGDLYVLDNAAAQTELWLWNMNTDVTQVLDNDIPGHMRWSGDMYQLPDTTWLVVWERQDGAPGTSANLNVYAIEAPTLDGPWSAPVKLSVASAVDPWIAIVGGSVFCGWQQGPTPGAPGFSWCKRTSLGVWNTPALLFSEVSETHSILEGTVSMIGSNVWLVYDRKPFPSDYLWEIAVRKITSNGAGGIQVGSRTTVVPIPDGPGMGTVGNQTRATICDTGAANTLLITYPKDASGDGLPTTNPRSIWAVRSTDNGVTWGSPYKIAEI